MIVAYGVANLLQSIAAANTDLHLEFSPRLLWRLGQHKAYLFGIAFQFAGFALAFLARRDLPLFLVQSAMAAGLGVTAVLGVLVLKWRLPGTEVVMLAPGSLPKISSGKLQRRRARQLYLAGRLDRPRLSPPTPELRS